MLLLLPLLRLLCPFPPPRPHATASTDYSEHSALAHSFAQADNTVLPPPPSPHHPSFHLSHSASLAAALFVGIASHRILFLAQSLFYLKKEKSKRNKKENQKQNKSAKYSRTYFCRENNKYRIIKLYTRLYLESEGKKKHETNRIPALRVKRIVHALTCLYILHSIIMFYIKNVNLI